MKREMLRACCLLFILFLFPASACAAKENATAGACGERANWSYADGVLTFSGTGAIADNSSSVPGPAYRQPWRHIREEITSVYIDDGITRIGAGTLAHCGNLQAVRLPESVTEIGEYAFFGCEQLQAVRLPARLCTMGSGAFAACSALTEIVLPEALTEIPTAAFCNCERLSDVRISDNVTNIHDSAFASCTSLSTLYLPKGIAHIGWRAFENLNALAYHTYAGIRYVGTEDNPYFAAVESDDELPADFAFHADMRVVADSLLLNAREIRTVTMGSRASVIGEGVFDTCYGVAGFAVDADNPYYTSDGRALYRLDDATLEAELVRYAVGNPASSYTVPESISHGAAAYMLTSIGDSAFLKAEALQSVALPDALKRIGDDAFANCTGLSYIELPALLTHLGADAFYGCTALSSVEIPGGVETVRYGTFEKCTMLTSATLSEGVRHIEIMAFDCDNLTEITLPNSLESIAEYAFGARNRKLLFRLLTERPLTVRFQGTAEAWKRVDKGILFGLSLGRCKLRMRFLA